jgi:bacterioferritin
MARLLPLLDRGKVVSNPMKDAVIAALMPHAADELRHADMVSNRSIQLGGTPVMTSTKRLECSNCKYDDPSDPS